MIQKIAANGYGLAMRSTWSSAADCAG